MSAWWNPKTWFCRRREVKRLSIDESAQVELYRAKVRNGEAPERRISKDEGPPRSPILIDERQLAIAKPGDLVMVTLPDAIKPNELDRFLAYVGQIAKDHGVRLWILDGGFGVTVVPHGDPRNMTATEARMRDIVRDEVRRERGRLASSRRERGGQMKATALPFYVNASDLAKLPRRFFPAPEVPTAAFLSAPELAQVEAHSAGLGSPAPGSGVHLSGNRT